MLLMKQFDKTVEQQDIIQLCFYRVTYAFQSESAPCSCLNVKELLARNSRDILNLSNCNGNWFQNHLVHKWTFNHLSRLETHNINLLFYFMQTLNVD